MEDNFLGTLFIVAAPSGGGKTSLVKNLISNLPDIEISISHTTRQKRPAEIHGKDYFFITNDDFTKMVNEDAFVEHAKVFDSHYGTSWLQIQQKLQNGKDVLLDIDWQGAQQIKKRFQNAVGVFIIPPSLIVLKERLLARQQDAEHIIKQRMQSAQDELMHYNEFDYLIVNDDFTKASYELQAIITANRLKIKRQAVKQKDLLSFLLSPQ